MCKLLMLRMCLCAETMQPCLEYLADPVNHTDPAVADGLAALRVCLEARMVLMSVLSRNDPTSLPAKTAGYSYIAKFGAVCRHQHLPPEHGAAIPWANPEKLTHHA